jgi:hypothetical protein
MLGTKGSPVVSPKDGSKVHSSAFDVSKSYSINCADARNKRTNCGRLENSKVQSYANTIPGFADRTIVSDLLYAVSAEALTL